jgi:hypothetical protein
VTFAGFDIPSRMEDEGRSFLEGYTSTIDSIVAAADVRPSFEGWWNILREPIELDDQVWLEIRPLTIQRGAIAGEGDVVGVEANLQARPRIFLGERPVLWDVELPPLREGPVDGALDILIEGAAEYDTGSRLLNEALAGQAVEAAGQRLELESLEVSGIGGGRLALAVRVRGDAAGLLFLVGTPSFDPEEGEVYVPDLDFSVETSSLLVDGASPVSW